MFRVLMLHKDFPGQFRPLARSLMADARVELRGMGQREEAVVSGLRPHLYQDMPAVDPGTHPYLGNAADYIIRGQCALRDAVGMAQQGYRPDLIVGHCGFGDTLYLKDLWPDVPLVGYFEYYYHGRGADVGFDPLYPVTLDDLARVRTLNVVNLLGLEAADLGVCPTEWQRALHPAPFRDRLRVMHEGIDTDLARPGPVPAFSLPDGTLLRQGDEVITYAARDLEPYRGFHVFMRALPEILRRRPAAQVVVAGGDGVSYGPPPPGGGAWRDHLMAEVGPSLDSGRVHFLGPVDHGRFLDLMRLSSAHVYLTYPFVLSWSMLEAMACGAVVVASATPPVEEVVRDGVNGLLFPFFDTALLADRVVEALGRQPQSAVLRRQARETVVSRFDARSRAVPAWRQALSQFGCPMLPAV
ncbi:glycosyltransferase [Nitrospirillum pindoramense]|uniref:Glycosyltransferase involved in cell wall biosynthesis n=1 Tax=Nitrospirillum amazonense TaxID=28077 RepID=A0A560H0D9_9PROT|nr:glycosyltransferase [Nitrospirillum amazonense]TWB39756.1 glycosyltransferase involved in cell wall biosynthesis [Nitrospirillum amazonense]